MNTPNDQQNLFSQPQPTQVPKWTEFQPRSVSRAFVLGGRAIFTVENGKGEYITYKVSVTKKDLKKSVEQRPHFLSVMTGRDNENSYTYAGLVRWMSGEFVATYASKYHKASREIVIFEWAMRHVWNNLPLPVGYHIRHAGKCGCCGRTLTTPESIERGIGPECWKRF
jgi:hypothetical protein